MVISTIQVKMTFLFKLYNPLEDLQLLSKVCITGAPDPKRFEIMKYSF